VLLRRRWRRRTAFCLLARSVGGTFGFSRVLHMVGFSYYGVITWRRFVAYELLAACPLGGAALLMGGRKPEQTVAWRSAPPCRMDRRWADVDHGCGWTNAWAMNKRGRNNAFSTGDTILLATVYYR
jgi:hypothetical protein